MSNDEQDRPVCVLGHEEPVEAFQGYLCRRHFHWVGDTLRQIEELFALTSLVLIPGPGNGERQGTRFGSPAPGRIGVMAITDKRSLTSWRDWEPEEGGDPEGAGDIPDVPGALFSWVRLMSEERLEAATTPEGEEHARELANINGDVASIVHRLHRERRWISQQAWVDDYAADLAALHRHVASAVGDSMWPKPVGRCPNDGASLFNTIGVDEITCRRCKFTWTGMALVRLRLIHEQDAKKEA